MTFRLAGLARDPHGIGWKDSLPIIYWSRNLIGPNPRNSTSFTRQFLAGRRARAGQETTSSATSMNNFCSIVAVTENWEAYSVFGTSPSVHSWFNVPPYKCALPHAMRVICNLFPDEWPSASRLVAFHLNHVAGGLCLVINLLILSLNFLCFGNLSKNFSLCLRKLSKDCSPHKIVTGWSKNARFVLDFVQILLTLSR